MGLFKSVFNGKKGRCRDRCSAWFPGAPDLVSSCKDACNNYGSLGWDRHNKCYFLENIVGDQISWQVYGIDCDTSIGIASEQRKEEEGLQQLLLQMANFTQAQNVYQTERDRQQQNSLLALEAFKISQADEQKQEQTKLILFLLIAMAVGFVIFKLL